MLIQLPATVTLDRMAIEPLIREIVVGLLQELSPEHQTGNSLPSKPPAHYLVSSIHPKDLLYVVEAPDVTAGERNEPHWRIVQDIRRGDVIIFRDSARKAPLTGRIRAFIAMPLTKMRFGGGLRNPDGLIVPSLMKSSVAPFLSMMTEVLGSNYSENLVSSVKKPMLTR